MSAPRGRALRALSALMTIFSVIAFLCQPGMGQGSPAGRGRFIRVGSVKQMRADVDEWPLIEHANDPAERRVNAALVQLNKELAETLRDCDASDAEFEKKAETTGKVSSPASDDWSRKVEVTMQGPRFLSMIATDGFFCGGAHPDDNLTVVVFDMRTGTLVDWASFLAKEAGASSTKTVLGYGDGTPPLVFSSLQTLYATAEENYCKDYFEDRRSFFLWPDAESGTLVVQVAGLPHVAAPCKVNFKLTLEQARKLGFAEEILRAIEDGHRQAESTGRH